MATSAVFRNSPQGHSLSGQNGAGPQLDNNNMAVLNDPDEQEKEFSSVTDKINIPSDVNSRALELWLNLLHTGRQEFQSDHQTWIICCIYIAALEAKFATRTDGSGGKVSFEQPCITLTDLLQVADMNIVTFYEKIRSVRNEFTITEHVQMHLMNIERKFIVVAPLYSKFEKIYHDVFQDEQTGFSNGANSPSQESSASVRMKSCWCLFILAKTLLLQNCNELVLPFQLLLCCLDHAIRMSPTFLLKPPYDTAQMNHYATSVVSESNSNSLRLLCEKFSCDHNDVLTVLRDYWQQFLETIPSEKLHQGIDGLPELSFLIEQYREVYQTLGDFNEILFLEHDPHLLPVTHTSSSQANSSGPSSNNRATETIPPTPVKTAMCTVQALQSILSHASDVPTPRLVRYFNNCPVNPRPGIEKRLARLQGDFLREVVAMTGPHFQETARKRWQLALRLFYRVMEAMLKSEEERLSMSDFSTLLHNDTFHKSLLAASIEVVMVTYGAMWNTSLSLKCEVSFPRILDVFDLKGFDFYKVLESFVKAEPRLTRDVIKHLQCIESQILERIAWQSDSPLFKFDAVKLATVAATSKFQDVSAGTLSPQRTTAADMYLSPLKFRQPTGAAANHRQQPSVGNSPTKGLTAGTSNAGNTQAVGDDKGLATPPRSQTLTLFFNKVLKLAYTRLQAMCKALDVNSEVERYIWTTVEHCTIHRPELLRDRHLDQIILCCIYGVSKAADSELKFKDIVAVYRKLYQSSPSVYKTVRICGEEFDSIIGFYNRLFMPALKTYVLQFQPNRVKPMLSPIPAKCQNSLTSPTVISVPGRGNFYVSPLKESPFKSPRPRQEYPSPSQMTPRSRTLYSFGEGLGSAEKLQKINEAMRAVKRSAERNTPKSQKRLKFDEGSDKEDTSEQNSKRLVIAANGINHKDVTSDSREVSNNNSGSANVLQRKLDVIASERRQVTENGKSAKS